MFRVVGRLGAGAAGTAFSVELIRDWNQFSKGKMFCLKWYGDDMFKRESPPVVIARRVREATIGGSQNHPNLVRVYDTSAFWVDGTPHYLLMELIQGESLYDLADRESLPSEVVQKLLGDVAQGLHALHSQGILHRDVKAANAMVNADNGRAVLLDLGVVRSETEETVTDAQAFLGTLRFASPEWLFAEQCTYSSDVYSLGTIAYHLLTGHELFHKTKLFSRLVMAVRNKVPSLPRKRKDWDRRRQYLSNLTLRMLKKKPYERPTLDEVLETLMNERKFEFWRWSVESGLLRQMPVNYHEDGESQREFIRTVMSIVPEQELRKIVHANDFKQLMTYLPPSERYNLRSPGERVTDYLSRPESERVGYALDHLKELSSGHLGQTIESRWHLIHNLYEAEASEEVRRQLKPHLRQAQNDMDMMMQDLAQENP